MCPYEPARRPRSTPQIGAHVEIPLWIGDLNTFLPKQTPDLVKYLALDVVHAVTLSKKFFLGLRDRRAPLSGFWASMAKSPNLTWPVRFGHFEWFKSLSFRARTLKGLHYGGGCGAICAVVILGGDCAGNASLSLSSSKRSSASGSVYRRNGFSFTAGPTVRTSFPPAGRWYGQAARKWHHRRSSQLMECPDAPAERLE